MQILRMFTDWTFIFLISFDKSTFFDGVSKDGVDTRRTFHDCVIEISNQNDVVLFINNVSIIESYINDNYIPYF